MLDITRETHTVTESIERHIKTLDALHVATALLIGDPVTVEKQNPGRLIGPPRRTTGTVPGCSSSMLHDWEVDVTSTSSWAFYERHFAHTRLQHYLTHTGGDQVAAMELYRWNAAISRAFWQSLAYFEVALRNALDERMSARHAARGRSGHWVFDDVRELGRDADGPGQHRQPYKDIAEGIRRVRRNQKPLSAGQIISEVSFGFWHQLISRHQMFLWPDLAGAFPHAPNRIQPTIQQPVARLREFRNRLGHHHRVWSEDVPARYTDLLAVAGYIDPDLKSFIDQHSLMSRLLQRQPE